MGDIKEIIYKLINTHGTSCPFKLAEKLDVQVEFEYLGKILGYYTKAFRVPVIKINESVPKKQQTFICGHELGHHILHPNENTSFLKRHTFYSTDRFEVEANKFAINLIVAGNDYLTDKDIEEYGIPSQLALLHSYNKIHP